MTNQQSHRPSEQGFTLVELAIVMVIIGLLIGGILKGQELITNARISSTVSQIKATDAALNTFEDKYNAKPGDMANANTRLPNCTAAPCYVAAAPNSDGKIGTTLATPPAVGNETGIAFPQLLAADLVSGIDNSLALTFGGQLPTVKSGGGMWVTFASDAAAPLSTTIQLGKHYAVLSGQIVQPGAATGVLSPSAAAQIDRKLDDGQPRSGSTQTGGTGCTTGTTTVTYDEAVNNGTCTLFSRVLN